MKCQQISCLKEPPGQPQPRYRVCAVTNPIWRPGTVKRYKQYTIVTLCNATLDLFSSITLALKMRETHVSLESVWERLVRAVEEGSKRPSKSLKGSKLKRTSNLTLSKTDIKLHTKKQCLRLSLRTMEYATNTYKSYFYTFKINQSTFTYGERKKERPNFYGMFGQNLPISTSFTAILKMKLPQCNAIGVRTPPGPYLNVARYWMT